MRKRVQLLKEAAAKTTRVAVLWDSRNSHETHGPSQATLAAERLNMALP